MLLDTEQALDAGAMKIFTSLLTTESAQIKAKAARDIFDLRYVNKSICYQAMMIK